MMGRILGLIILTIFAFKELHFFGTIWTNHSESTLDRETANRFAFKVVVY